MKNDKILCVENIYSYDNYRTFLSDYFDEVKEKKKQFSHRFFASKAGFSSPSFVHQVIKGSRNVSADSLKKLIHGLGFEGKIATYFSLLVNYNQCKSTEEKEKYRMELDEIRKISQFYKMNKSHVDYCRHPYLHVLRELVTYSTWDDDYRKLASLVSPSITPRQAKEGVETLCELGLIEKKGKNYIQKDKVLTMQDVPVVYKKDMRRDMLLQGVDAVENFPIEDRHASFGVISMSEKNYHEISLMMDEFRRKVFAKITDDNEVDRVYNLSLQLFPMSKNISDNNEGVQ